MKRILLCTALLCCAAAFGQQVAKKPLPPVTVTGLGNPVEKSYRSMLDGAVLFERMHSLAPNAPLRFKLLPRKAGTNMRDVELEVIGSSFSYPVEVADDQTFALKRDEKALREDAVVSPNRRQLSMTWRTEIRSPGVPEGMRRLGDLRLECLVGIEAGLVSNSNAFTDMVSNLFRSPTSYCGRKDAKYLFFAQKPIFGVTLVAGARRESLAINRLYAEASDDPGLKADMPFCDCEVMLDRTYYLPLGDPSWPDDTLVQFDYMEDAPPGATLAAPPPIAPGRTKDDVVAALGRANVITFDSGWEVWFYREQSTDRSARPLQERVVLFDPSGVVKNVRDR